jgi:hypothetical protein
MRAAMGCILLMLGMTASAHAQSAPPGSFNFGGSGSSCIAIEPGTGACIQAGQFGTPEPAPAPMPPQTGKPLLWLLAQVTTPREKEIFTKVRQRLVVAFTVKTDESGALPPIGYLVKMFTANGQTAISMLHFAPRPPVSLYRSLATGMCPVTITTDKCADMIVETLYQRAGEWHNIPAYSGSGG